MMLPSTTMDCDSSEDGQRNAEGRIRACIERYDARFAAFAHFIGAMAKTGITGVEFDIYRRNYLYRTENTFASISAALASATRRRPNDSKTIGYLFRTVKEEWGKGGVSHRDMLLSSHNIHARVIFGLQPITFEEVDTADLCDEVRRFRLVQDALYQSTDHLQVIGAFVAQESAAESMLSAFYESFFAPYMDRYTEPSEVRTVKKYFEAHLNGTEKKHANRAMKCAIRTCRTSAELDVLLEAMTTLQDAQLELWSGMMREWKWLEF